jgi:hypothetical protein
MATTWMSERTRAARRTLRPVRIIVEYLLLSNWMSSQTYTAEAVDAYFAGGRRQCLANGDFVD